MSAAGRGHQQPPRLTRGLQKPRVPGAEAPAQTPPPLTLEQDFSALGPFEPGTFSVGGGGRPGHGRIPSSNPDLHP